MPLTLEEYACLDNFSVLFSGGLDSTAVPLIIGPLTRGSIQLLTYKHRYGSLANEWSRRHIPELKRELGERVEHHLVDHTPIWNEIGAKRMLLDAARYGGHFVCCLGCQCAMATHTIIHNLERGITNVFICSSVGGEYAVMSMPITREKKAAFYARFGMRYNAPLLDLGIRKPEEVDVLRSHGMEPGWGKRRSHNGYQPICLLGFQHALDIVLDFHTTYDPAKVARFLDDKFPIMERIIRRTLRERGHDPDQLIARNVEAFLEEEQAIARVRERQGRRPPSR